MSSQQQSLPPGWSTASIGELCDYNPKHDRTVPDDAVISFVPMSAVSEVTGRIESPERRSLGEVRKGFTHFAEDDVIWAKITPCMENGKSAVAENLLNGLACGSTEFMVFRTHGGILPKYLHRYLRQESYRKAARQTMQSGVGQARVPKEFVLETELPVPPLNEQCRIVTKLEDLQTRSEAAKEALDAVPPLLERFRQSVLAAAFRGDLTKDWRAVNPDVEPAPVLLERIRAERRDRWVAAEAEKGRAKAEAKALAAGKTWTPADEARVLEQEHAKASRKYQEPEPVNPEGLPELPQGWCWASLDELAWSIKNGTSKTPSGEAGIPILRISAIRPQEFRGDDIRFIPESEDDYSSYLIENGDILFTRYNGNASLVGVCAVVENLSRSTIYPDKLIRVKVIDNFVSPHYVASAAIQGVSRDFIRAHSKTAAGQVGISGGDLKLTPVPLAPLSEQQRVWIKIQQNLSIYQSVKSSQNQNQVLLASLNQSILAKAFRGELVPQDPTDEPASVLLERIRAERQADGSTGRRRGRKPSAAV